MRRATLNWTASRIIRTAKHVSLAMLFSVGLFSPHCATAQVRLGPEAMGGNYNVQVMSWAEIPFRTIVRQQYDFSCGSAAVATLLTHHYDRPTAEHHSFAAMWKAGDQKIIQKSGFSMYDMKMYLQSIGFHAEGYRLSLEDFAKSKRPAIVLLNLRGFKHFVVVKGVRGNTVLVGDPIRGLEQYDAKEFMKSWNGIALAIVKNKQYPNPLFNLTREWSPWSTAPLSESAETADIGNLTSNLPQIYQLTPQLLLAVRVGTVGQ
jgi:uncharacterized protein